MPTLDAILAPKPASLALIDPPNKQRVTSQLPRQPTYAKADREISALAAHFRPSRIMAVGGYRFLSQDLQE